MVSLITVGTSTDHENRPFPRRRMRPWLILVVVLLTLGVGVWAKALTIESQDSAAMPCNPPSRATDPHAQNQAPLGRKVGNGALNSIQPAPVAGSEVRVLNANGQRGQASHIAAQLGDLGFASPPGSVSGNDTIYANGDLECTGQIRFGERGKAAAAAVQLTAPCAELIQDDRPDAQVDLVLGSLFGGDIQPSTDASEVLKDLKNTAPGNTPQIDSDLLEAARHAKC